MHETLVNSLVESFKESPIDILQIGDNEGEYVYLKRLAPSYTRTVDDIDYLLNQKKGAGILEIGSYLGVVSAALKRLDYDVEAVDIPEFHRSPDLQKFYKRNGVPFTGINLRNAELPFDSGAFDAVIICEVLEHLNFNPLPALKEINRVLKKGGILYIGMPNQARFINRVKMLAGQSVHHPVDYFFRQLDAKDNMIVGLHWREYTLAETVTLVKNMGFRPIKKYYYSHKHFTYKSMASVIKLIIDIYPPFRTFQVVISEKVETPVHDFFITQANS